MKCVIAIQCLNHRIEQIEHMLKMCGNEKHHSALVEKQKKELEQVKLEIKVLETDEFLDLIYQYVSGKTKAEKNEL